MTILYITINMIMTYLVMAIGYIIGLKIWDFYYEKVIVPKIEKRERQRRLEFIEACKTIGNPKTTTATL